MLCVSPIDKILIFIIIIFMETALMQSPTIASGAKNRRPRVVRCNITLTKDLLTIGAKKAAAGQFPSLSEYFRHLIRIDSGMAGALTPTRQ